MIFNYFNIRGYIPIKYKFEHDSHVLARVLFNFINHYNAYKTFWLRTRSPTWLESSSRAEDACIIMIFVVFFFFQVTYRNRFCTCKIRSPKPWYTTGHPANSFPRSSCRGFRTPSTSKTRCCQRSRRSCPRWYCSATSTRPSTPSKLYRLRKKWKWRWVSVIRGICPVLLTFVHKRNSPFLLFRQNRYPFLVSTWETKNQSNPQITHYSCYTKTVRSDTFR